MKNLFRLLFIGAVVLSLAFLIFSSTRKSEQSLEISDLREIKGVKIGGVYLKVEVAETPEEHTKGLSGKESLPQDEAMLFVFNTPGKYNFWMKNMNFPIDIIWIGENQDVVYMKKNALPGSYPEMYAPDKNAKYVLETISSFSEKNNLKIGDKVVFLSR